MKIWLRGALVGVLSMGMWASTEEAAWSAKATTPPMLTTKVKTLTVFKDGTALFEREGQLSEAKWHVMPPPPAAILGSLWFENNAKGGLERVLLRKGWRTYKRVCRSMLGLLRANGGNKATLSLHDKSELTGVLKALPKDKPMANGKPSPVPAFVLLTTKTGTVVVPIEQIKRASFAGTPRGLCARQKRQLLLWLRSSGASTFRYSYLQKGLQWTPLYRLRLGKKKARLEMQAVVSNNKESVKDTVLRLVVGVPNIVNQSMLSPMSPGASTSPMPYRHYYNRHQQNYRTQMFSNAYSRHVNPHTNPAGQSTLATYQGSAKDLGNLFVFAIKGKVSLAKGARVLVPVMKATLPYKRFYQWEPGASVTQRAHHRRRHINLQQHIQSRVWVYIQLHNSSQVPLTTGPAAIVDKGDFAAQDILRYTPPGGKVEIPVTVAANILSQQSQTEVSRNRSAKRWNSHWYSYVVNKVSLTLVNFSKKTVSVRIKKRVSGEVKEAKGAKIHVDGSGGNLNATSEVLYKVTIPPKGRWNGSFRYGLYVY